MKKEDYDKQTKRIFLGIPISISGEIKRMFDLAREELKEEKIRWVSPENLHITLLFIGETEPPIIEKIQQILADQTWDINPFELQFRGLGVFKTVYQPKVLFLGIDESVELMSLKGKINDSLLTLQLEALDKEKTFHPHLTIGRPKYIKNRTMMKEFLENNQNELLEKRIVKEFVLFESRLTSEGPVYRPLSTVALNSS